MANVLLRIEAATRAVVRTLFHGSQHPGDRFVAITWGERDVRVWEERYSVGRGLRKDGEGLGYSKYSLIFDDVICISPLVYDPKLVFAPP